MSDEPRDRGELLGALAAEIEARVGRGEHVDANELTESHECEAEDARHCAKARVVTSTSMTSTVSEPSSATEIKPRLMGLMGFSSLPGLMSSSWGSTDTMRIGMSKKLSITISEEVIAQDREATYGEMASDESRVSCPR